jgi:hypothetical protein
MNSILVGHARDLPPIGNLPNPRRAVIARARNILFARAENDGSHLSFVVHPTYLLTGGFPRPNCTIGTGCGDVFPGVAEGDGMHHPVMAHAGNFLTICNFPKPRCAISASCDQILAIRTELDADHFAFVKYTTDFATAGGLPNSR